MITAEEFVLEINNSEESKIFKLGTVVELFDNNTAKIQFDGENIPSEKQYAYLESYKPVVDDRVLLAIVGGTYIILGKVNYNKEPSNSDEVINDIKSDITAINGEVTTLKSEVTTIKSGITTLNSKVDSIESVLPNKIGGNVAGDSNGNMNIDYMYVDPNTKQLNVRRKNGVWTVYNPI